MKRNRPKRRGAYRPALLWVSIFSVLLVAALVAQTFAEESISVSCYNLQKSRLPIGSVVVYDTAQAALACNSTYYDCRGRCVGCFADSDYFDAVCVDVRGTMFLK